MFQLIDLPYALDALEPVISARTLEFHHGKHLQAYVDNLNKLIAGTEYESLSLEQIVISSAAAGGVEKSKAIFNNAGQVLNHNLYFTQFKAAFRLAVPRDQKGSAMPAILPRPPKSYELTTDSALGRQITEQWGSIDAFREEFVAKGVGLFGSGWVWLQADAAGTLSIGQYPGADNPVAHGLRPILTFDVWEHAYDLDYQNRRAAQLEALWRIVDWKVVEERF